ncbi:RICIN domain-containing protein [Streptomyces blastmyceticus]|uniref:Ricin B lectin domain-containing protein n=1 Tax=Streptomyces blastmyceticus TaxID=68180 RepID=A0ABN0XFQ5_9ACTN
MMARIVRAALAVGTIFTALVGCAATAHAEGSTSFSVAATETVVRLEASHSGKCLDLNNVNPGKTKNGAHALQWECDGTNGQQWRVIPANNSSFEIRSVASGKCLEVENSGTQAGATIQQWDCNGGKNMRWSMVLVDQRQKLFQLRPTHTEERCLDVYDAGTGNGATVQQWYCNQTAAQLWRILPVS